MRFRGPGHTHRRRWVRAVAIVTLAADAALLVRAPAYAGPLHALLHPQLDASASAAAEPLASMPEYRSYGGELRVTLEARETRARLGPYAIQGATYNGVYGGPVLRLRPGDVLRLTLVNHLKQATNIHFHGLEVSPQGHGDNAMHMVLPGEAWDYVIAIPKDHPPGVYWFHTHGHGFAERQLMGGLSGTIVIDGFEDEVPATLPLRQRLMALKEFSSNAKGQLNAVPKPFNGQIKTINGQLMPRIDIRPGETQLWRLSDQTANTYFRLSLDGHAFTVVGRDAHPVIHPEIAREVILGPSERIDLLVTGAAAGRYRLVAEKTNTGPVGDMFPAQPMALLISAPDPSQPPPVPLGPLTVEAKERPIPGERVDARRLVSFSEDPVTGLFFINHAMFDHERVDVKVPLGNIEEWTIRNASDELHVFHIHQVAFQIVSINGKPEPFDGLVDTVNVPIHGEVKIRIAFTDPTIVGRFMFHCHILEHEDKGMMSQIEVYDPKVGPMADGHDIADMGEAHMLHQGGGAGQARGADQIPSPEAVTGTKVHAPQH